MLFSSINSFSIFSTYLCLSLVEIPVSSVGAVVLVVRASFFSENNADTRRRKEKKRDDADARRRKEKREERSPKKGKLNSIIVVHVCARIRKKEFSMHERDRTHEIERTTINNG